MDLHAARTPPPARPQQEGAVPDPPRTDPGRCRSGSGSEPVRLGERVTSRGGPHTPGFARPPAPSPGEGSAPVRTPDGTRAAGPPPDTGDAAPSGEQPPPADGVQALRTELAQLRQAMETRPVIDQARGVLMASWRCTPHTAWQVLVDASQRTNTKLREIAVLLTGSTQGEPLPDWLRSAVLSSYARVAGTPAPGRGPRPR